MLVIVEVEPAIDAREVYWSVTILFHNASAFGRKGGRRGRLGGRLGGHSLHIWRTSM